MNVFPCGDRNLAINMYHPLHTEWLNEIVAFSYRSGNLRPCNRIMTGMFSYVQYKTMEQWGVCVGPGTLYKVPSMLSHHKILLTN